MLLRRYVTLVALLAASCSGPHRSATTSPSGEGPGSPPPQGALQAAATEASPVAGQGAPVAGQGAPSGPLFTGRVTDCRQTGLQLLAVEPRIQAVNPRALSLAVGGERIALAWVEGPSQGSGEGRTHVALLNGRLDVVAETTVRLQSSAIDVAIAETPRGWMLAVARESSLDVVPLSSDLRPAPVQSYPDGSAPILAGRPDGTPLLTYFRYSGERGQKAVLLEEDGSARFTVHLFDRVTEGTFGSAVWTGTDFLVAQRVDGVSVVRVGLDGQLGEVHAELGSSTEYPQLAPTASGATMTYADFGDAPSSLRWASLDGEGRLRAGGTRLGNVPIYFNRSPLASLGDDTLVALARHTGGTGRSDGLDLAVLAPDGSPRGEACSVLPEGPTVIAAPRLVRLGERAAVLAWIRITPQPGIGVARIHLPTAGGGGREQ